MSWKARYFKPHEFDSPDISGSGERMHEEFIQKLDELRDVLGRPLAINSGFRSEAHNAKLSKAVGKSAHTEGWAADIKVNTSTERLELVKFSLIHGFTRIGVAETFIHLDMDPSKPKNVLWLYT